MKMRPEEVTVHSVSMPDMYVLGGMFTNGKEWPKTIQHNGHTFHYVANEIMPDFAIGNYGGYAHYECRDYSAQLPVTHVEFGAYLTAIGFIMRSTNVALSDVIEPSGDVKAEMIRRLMTLCRVDQIRANYILNYCWSKMRSLSPSTIPADDPIALAERLQWEHEDDGFCEEG